MRLWLVVIEDPDSDLKTDDEAAAYITGLIDSELSGLHVRAVRRGGIYAKQVLGDFVPVRHQNMGRPRG